MTKSGTGNRGRAPDRDAGFSLLELILVLVVLSLVLAIAYPSMSRGKTAFHLRAVGRDVISSFRGAREMAVTEQKVMQTVIDIDGQQVTICDDVGDGARTFHLPADVKLIGLNRAGEEVTQGVLTVRFLPNGSSDNAMVFLKADTGASLKIGLDPITGSARIMNDEVARTP